jgi:hypothetical protein
MERRPRRVGTQGPTCTVRVSLSLVTLPERPPHASELSSMPSVARFTLDSAPGAAVPGAPVPSVG